MYHILVQWSNRNVLTIINTKHGAKYGITIDTYRMSHTSYRSAVCVVSAEPAYIFIIALKYTMHNKFNIYHISKYFCSTYGNSGYFPIVMTRTRSGTNDMMNLLEPEPIDALRAPKKG